MPNTRSASKAARQARERRARNRMQMSALRTAVKRVRAAADADAAREAFRLAEQVLDRAARKGLIHHNNAARRKARLARIVQEKSGTA